MASFKTTIRTLLLFIIPRYPFINAVTLLLLLAERARREKYPPMDPNMIYGHLILFVVCGVCMSFNFRRKDAALVHSGQLIYFALNIYNNDKLGYSRWLRARMTLKCIGVAGITVLYAFYSMRKPRSLPLKRIAESIIGIILGALMYTVLESAEDRTAFTTLMPGGNISLYAYTLILGGSALCFLPGWYVYDVAVFLVPALIFPCIFVDCNINYWTNKRGVDFWNQIRMMSDGIFMILGVIMMLVCSVKKLPVSEAELRRQEEREHAD